LRLPATEDQILAMKEPEGTPEPASAEGRDTAALKVMTEARGLKPLKVEGRFRQGLAQNGEQMLMMAEQDHLRGLAQPQ